MDINDNNKENAMPFVPIKRDLVIHRRSSMRVCKDCGKFYVLADSDSVHFITKYGSLPLRCEDCRRRIREANPIEKKED